MTTARRAALENKLIRYAILVIMDMNVMTSQGYMIENTCSLWEFSQQEAQLFYRFPTVITVVVRLVLK